jgi:hypothetical protein
MNPFTDAYLNQELDFYGSVKPQKVGSVVIKNVKPEGRVDDYLNKNLRQYTRSVPTLHADGKLWMSLTHMEVQSAWVPIRMSHGAVIAGGLGLGYYPLRAAAKPEVTSVTVVEENPDVIRFFNSRFKNRPEFGKIKIVKGDARVLIPRMKADFCLMDIYGTMCPEQTLDDAEHFLKKAKGLKLFRFWGEELAILSVAFDHGASWFNVIPGIPKAEREFFRFFYEADFESVPGAKLHELFQPLSDTDYLIRYVHMRRSRRNAA